MAQNLNTADLVNQRLHMGHHLRAVGSYERAIEQYRATLALDPDCALAYVNLALVLKDVGLNEEALSEAEKALSLEPFNDRFLHVKGLVLSKMEQRAGAQAMFEQAIAINSNYSDYFADLSLILHKQGWHIEAVEAAKHALELDPESDFALRCAGYALTKSGRYDEARNVFEKALQLYPDASDSYAGMAYFYQHIQDDERSLFYAEEALRLNPETDGVRIVPVEESRRKLNSHKSEQPTHILNQDIGVLMSRLWAKMSVSQRYLAVAFIMLITGAACLGTFVVYKEMLALGTLSTFPLAVFIFAFLRGLNQK